MLLLIQFAYVRIENCICGCLIIESVMQFARMCGLRNMCNHKMQFAWMCGLRNRQGEHTDTNVGDAIRMAVRIEKRRLTD